MADAAYGLWPLVVLNTLLFVVFAASFFLVYVYARLARTEEREVARRFGEEWRAYAAITPAFWPRLRGNPPHSHDPRPLPHGVNRDDRDHNR